jgi:hypothetical protein
VEGCYAAKPVKVEEAFEALDPRDSYSVKLVGTGACKRVEDFGVFGEEEFSCLQMDFTLTRKGQFRKSDLTIRKENGRCKT